MQQHEWHGSHEHGSDEEADLYSPRRQRSRSFSDAEDILNSGGNSSYESVSMENKQSDLPPNDLNTTLNTMNIKNHNHTGNGLHHRSTNTHHTQRQIMCHHTPDASRMDPYRTPTPKRKPLHYNTKQPRSHSLIKWFLALGFGSYIMLLVRSSYWLLEGSTQGGVDPTAWPSVLVTSGGQATSQQHQQNRHPQLKRLSRKDSRRELEKRAQQRRDRLRPPKYAETETESIAATTSWYTVERMDQRRLSSNAPPELPAPLIDNHRSVLDQLCGFHAQNASLISPGNYPVESALNPKARVLITGILGPLGLSLALHLKNECGVEVIGGMDNMYPNTVQNRLQVQDRLQLLTTNIPKLIKPILLPFFGLDPKTNKKKEGGASDEEFDLMSLKPTHIVHLASYSQDVYSNALVDPLWKNMNSPYVTDDYNPNLYPLRSSMVSMEHILQNLATAAPEERPQFIYASSSSSSSNILDHPVHATSKLIDELLAEHYDIPSIGLRLPNAIYGPWGQTGAVLHDMVESAIQQWNATKDQLSSIRGAQKQLLDLVYVDDAVDAIVAAMQYRTSHPITVDVTSGIETSVASTAATIQSFLPHGSAKQRPQAADHNPFLQKLREQHQSRSTQRRLVLDWAPKTSIREGMLQTIAWHLDRDAPYGPTVETGDAFLKRHDQKTCAPEDLQCHKGRHYLPCLSECNTRDQCLPSVFDEVKQLIYNVTEGCDVVLYTQSLGYNVQDLSLNAQYMDDSHLGDDDTLLCNFAFIPRDSDLVSTVIDKVPDDQLAKFGIKPHESDVGKAMWERKLDGLNGRLLYKGWVLIWMRDAVEPLSVADKSLLKLSPGRLFPPEVTNTLFVEENFSVSPNIEDVLFLVGELRRKAFPKRTLKNNVLVRGPHGKQTSKRVKYRLPAEPQRQAAILFAPLRFPNVDDPSLQKYRTGNLKLTIHDAAKFMRYEVGTDKVVTHESAEIRRQREFYERVPSYINRITELRSNYEPWYRYAMRHWVRTRWVVHDLQLEESRLLRCDWYQEHVQWGTDLDQLSFAHVMATRELKRRMAHGEPDDHTKTFMENHPALKDLTDSYEWHPMETEPNKLYREPTKWTSQLPDHFPNDEDAPDEHEDDSKKVPLFVRIMSEKIMATSRKMWNKKMKNRRKEIAEQHKHKKAK